MAVAVADTHTVIWYLFDDARLSTRARETIESGAENKQIGAGRGPRPWTALVKTEAIWKLS